MAVAGPSRRGCLRLACRTFSGGPETVEELLDRHLEKPSSARPRRRADEEDPETRRKLTSARREALSLYRDIFRASRAFVWPNKEGVLWRDVLRASARQEFEQARYESDPEVIARLIIVGRDAVEAAVDKLVQNMSKGPTGD